MNNKCPPASNRFVSSSTTESPKGHQSKKWDGPLFKRRTKRCIWKWMSWSPLENPNVGRPSTSTFTWKSSHRETHSSLRCQRSLPVRLSLVNPRATAQWSRALKSSQHVKGKSQTGIINHRRPFQNPPKRKALRKEPITRWLRLTRAFGGGLPGQSLPAWCPLCATRGH